MDKAHRFSFKSRGRQVACALAGFWFFICCISDGNVVELFFDAESPLAAFAANEIQGTLQARGFRTRKSSLNELKSGDEKIRIVIALGSLSGVAREFRAEGGAPLPQLAAEGFSLRTTSHSTGRKTYWVLGSDEAGMMYGGLELAEIVRMQGFLDVIEADESPYMALRGIKFNIPLDARTPSYSDVSDAAQKNIAEMWNFSFWKEFIDNLARYRYNFVSLWSLHPFPSLVRVPDYPEVVLEDVKRSTADWKEHYDLTGRGFDSPQILGHLETLREMSVDEKIDFWRRVMRYARERNVAFSVVTWNIFVNGTNGKYGITDGIDNQITVDYFRKSVKELLLTYPLLAGIGLTTGENMGGASLEEKEDWAFNAYAEGVLDAAAQQPGRKFIFIHRQHQTGAEYIADRFAPVIAHEDVEFIYSFKYAQAHVYSSTRQSFHENFVNEIGDRKTIWTLRNDDVYHFRWGAPDFVRQFLKNIPRRVSRGFYLGSDQYVWGREFLSTEPESPRQLEIVKHWYHWMLWGRLGYSPDLPNERFISVLQNHFPETDSEKLFTAWQEASMVYPKTTGFHWGALDFQWYIEGCKSRSGPAQTTTGFHNVDRFITLPPHPETGNVSIPQYVDAVASGASPVGTTPVELSEQLHGHADRALAALDDLSHEGNKELRLTLGDIRAISYLGKYYAHKIRGATELALFRKGGQVSHQEAAVRELTKAAENWRQYASTALGQYENPLWLNRVGITDWRELFSEVLQDILSTGGSVRLTSVPATSGGTILEAETAVSGGAEKKDHVTEYTGEGYLDFGSANRGGWIEWIFEAPEKGTYLLEVRYALETGLHPAPLTINGEDAGRIVLWPTGGRSTWMWDRKPLVLEKGTNHIKLLIAGTPLVDHLNVLWGGPDL